MTLNQKLHWLKQTVGLSLPDHHSRSELEATADLLISYADILGTDDNRRGTFTKPIRIPTNGQSRSQKQHPIAQALEDDVDAEIACMASEGVIEPCNDPKGFNSPVFAVRKKNGKIRVVANFKRTLNKVLVDLDPYPIPTIDSTFNKIGEGNKYFSTLDLRNGYWQIVIDELDRHKTAFTWKGRCFQYTRLAFGLTSAGQIFRCIAEALDTVASRANISSYIDDNLVHAKTFEEYVTALEQLFIALRKFGLKLNTEKCIFLASEAKFLGRIVNSDGFKADPEYVRAIIDMKPPTTRKELQSLIGRLVWIRQFIETRLNESIRTDIFSNLMAPINELNKPGRTFVWTEGANKAFNKIKKCLASPPIISFPDFTGLFTLTTDASDIACGAILMQEDKHGQKKIIAVASHTFNATERNWSTTEREAYAIKWAITKFDYFLRSRPSHVLGSTWIQQCEDTTMAGGNIVLQIRLGICRRRIKCLGRHAQSEIWPQQGQAYGRPDTCRDALQTPRLQSKHLRSILVPWRNQELPAAPWDSHNTEHSASSAGHRRIRRVSCHIDRLKR